VVKFKRKNKRKDETGFALDFVTALTVEECRDYLEHEDLEGSDYTQRASLSKNGYLSIEREALPFPSRNPDLIKFEGWLKPVAGGTHVQGAITERTRAMILPQIQYVFTLLLAVLWGGPILLGVSADLWPLLLVFSLPLLLFGWRQWIIKRRVHHLIDWIRDQLYTLPAPPTAANPPR
jgi:hypothetical protein